MKNSINEFVWNYSLYYVVNLTTGRVLYELEDLDVARCCLRDLRLSNRIDRFIIQKQHMIATIVK